MSYINAAQLLPKELLLQIQEYTEGSIIYIPNKPGLRRCWGQTTDTKALVDKRNCEIRQAYVSGDSVKKLSSKFYLSESTIRKIVYNR